VWYLINLGYCSVVCRSDSICEAFSGFVRVGEGESTWDWLGFYWMLLYKRMVIRSYFGLMVCENQGKSCLMGWAIGRER